MYSFLAWFSQILLLLLGFFLIVVVLLQRGRGGGLAGAFGGMGGQSAFGTKAGDVFTKITIVIAILWVVVSGASGFAMRAASTNRASQFGDAPPVTTTDDPAVPQAPAENPPQRPQPPAGTSSAESGAGAASTPAGETGAPATQAEGAAPTTGAEPAGSPEAAEPEASSAPAIEGAGDAPSQN